MSEDHPITERDVRRLCAEIVDRVRRGEACRVEEYLTAFPGLGGSDAALDLVYTEYVARLEQNRAGLAAEFYARFPEWRDKLRDQFFLHDWLREHVSPDPVSEAPAGCGDGRYEVLAEVGRGGMGVVYKARDRRLNRVVALKALRDGAAAPAGDAARLRREAELLAGIDHPHVVRIHGLEEGTDGPILVLEYVGGGSLARPPGGGRRPPARAARLVEAAARAVDALHRQGVVHHDLKPSNVLLTEAGVPKLTDFGLAGSARGGPDGRPPGGTSGYIAPERRADPAGGAGPAGDIYSLGVILGELLTGVAPGDAAGWPGPLPPFAPADGIPAALEAICRRCVDADPARRYPSAAALADDLRRYFADRAIDRPIGE
jgi:serine/threonine protein kinase